MKKLKKGVEQIKSRKHRVGPLFTNAGSMPDWAKGIPLHERTHVVRFQGLSVGGPFESAVNRFLDSAQKGMA